MKYFYRGMLVYPCFLFLSLMIPSSQAAVIIKVKSRHALLHLEGTKTSAGDYYKVTDLYGKMKGLMRIKRVGSKKAIGVLKTGSMETNWAIEPMSRRVAYKMMRKLAEKRKQALLKKKQVRRKVASSEEAYLDDQGLGTSTYDDNYSSTSEDSGSRFTFNNFKIGLSSRGGLNSIKLIGEEVDFLSNGLGWSTLVFLEAFVSQHVKLNLHGGWERFHSSTEDSCDIEDVSSECELLIDYALVGAGVKLSLLNQKSFDLWLGLEGNLKYPVQFMNNINLTEDSFSGLHGDMGVGLGLDIYLGSVVIPIAFSGNLFMPPTESVLAGTGTISLGLGWTF